MEFPSNVKVWVLYKHNLDGYLIWFFMIYLCSVATHEYSSSLYKHGFLILIFSYASFCEDGLGLMCKLPSGDNYIYLLSMDNWYSIMWHIYYLSSLHWLLLLITLSLANKCICFNSYCLPWVLWFHLILLNLFCVILNVVEMMIPFMCILNSNAKS
jgi:hypothetical protein